MRGTDVNDIRVELLANRLKSDVERLAAKLHQQDMSLEEVRLELYAIRSLFEIISEDKDKKRSEALKGSGLKQKLLQMPDIGEDTDYDRSLDFGRPVDP